MAEVADPVAVGLVASFARPGGNITGLTTLSPDLDGKRLELLKEILPNVTRVAFIWDPANSANRIRFKEVQSAAQALAITLQSMEVRNPTELASAFEAAIRERPGALMVPNPTVLTYGRQIADYRTLPTCSVALPRTSTRFSRERSQPTCRSNNRRSLS